jgi:hypothetical protein
MPRYSPSGACCGCELHSIQLNHRGLADWSALSGDWEYASPILTASSTGVYLSDLEWDSDAKWFASLVRSSDVGNTARLILFADDSAAGVNVVVTFGESGVSDGTLDIQDDAGVSLIGGPVASEWIVAGVGYANLRVGISTSRITVWLGVTGGDPVEVEALAWDELGDRVAVAATIAAGTVDFDTVRWLDAWSEWETEVEGEFDGDWSLRADELLANAAGRLIYNRTYFQEQWVQVSVRSATPGDTASLHVRTSAAGVGVGLEIRVTLGEEDVSCGSIDVLDDEGASLLDAVQLDRYLIAGAAWYVLTVCVSDSRILVSCNGTSLAADLAAITHAGGDLAISAGNAGVAFKDLTWWRVKENCKDCDPCTASTGFMHGARWEPAALPAGPLAAVACDEVRDVDSLTEVDIRRTVLNAWDREHGYTVFAIGEAPLTLVLDGGHHTAEFEVVEVESPYTRSAPDDLPSVMDVLKVTMRRDGALLATRDVWLGDNRVYDNPPPGGFGTDDLAQFFASLQGDRFAAGLGNGWAGQSIGGIVTDRRPFLEATTTASHNGHYVGYSLPSGSTNYPSLVDVWRCAFLPSCRDCDAGHVDRFSVELPAFDFEVLTVGSPITRSFAGGTRIMQFTKHCYWEHATEADHLLLTIEELPGLLYRFVLQAYVLGADPNSHDDYRVAPGYRKFVSASFAALDCVGANGLELSWENDPDVKALLTAI